MTKCLDSSVLLAFLHEGSHVELFHDTAYCSTLAFFEVERVLLRKLHRKEVESTMTLLKSMMLTMPVDMQISSLAAQLSITHKLATADAIMLATAQSLNMTLYTRDSDFANIKGAVIVN